MNNLNSYMPYNKPHPGEDCGICLSPLESNLVAHGGEGHKHPLHLNCAKDIFTKGGHACPICRVEIDPMSLLTLKERLILIEWKNIKSDGRIGVILAQQIIIANFIFDTIYLF